jgi:hypothetical protein
MLKDTKLSGIGRSWKRIDPVERQPWVILDREAGTRFAPRPAISQGLTRAFRVSTLSPSDVEFRAWGKRVFGASRSLSAPQPLRLELLIGYCGLFLLQASEWLTKLRRNALGTPPRTEVTASYTWTFEIVCSYTGGRP